jgi:hypothetical protein
MQLESFTYIKGDAYIENQSVIEVFESDLVNRLNNLTCDFS